MKTILSLSILLASFLVNAQSETNDQNINDGVEITITVPVQSTEGNVVFGLYNEATFMRNPIDGLEGEIKDGKSVVTFKNVTPGSYAVILFHDKNQNKQMDFDLNGMPLEMFGVSNNIMNLGPPQWTDAKFEVAAEPLSLDIRM